MTDLASLVVRMQADNSQYVKALDQATQKLQKFSKDQETILDDLAGKFAAAFSIDKIVEFSAGAIEGAAAMQRFSQIAGVSVETLSSLSIAAGAAGIGQDELAISFKKLNVAISDAAGDASSKAGIAFKLLGVNVKDSNGNVKDAATVTDEVADAFAGAADGANKTALAVALYGKAGQQMIPLLNQGAAGLHATEQAAIDSGAALSGPAAKAAEELETKLKTLELEAKGGLESAIADSLIPVLDQLADSFSKTTNYASAFSGVGAVIAGAVKVIASVVIEATSEFEQLGNSIGAVGAAAVAVAKGNFSEASDIWAASNADNAAIAKKYADINNGIWNAEANSAIAAAKKAADGVSAQQPKANLGSLAGGIKSAEADKELEKFSSGLRDQAGAFGLGAEASARYKLSFGPLADALKIAGKAGQDAAAQARAAAHDYQFKIDDKTYKDLTKTLQEQIDTLDVSEVAAFNYKITTGELGDAFGRMGQKGSDAQAKLRGLNNQLIDDKDAKAVQAINDKLDELSGKLVTAAGHAFDLQNKSLTQNLSARGDQAGLDQVSKLRDATVAQAAYDEELQKGQQIQATYAATAADIALNQSKGLVTDLQAQQQLNQAQLTEIAGLQQVYAAEKQIADTSGIQSLIDKTKAFSTELVDLAKNTNQLESEIRQDLENSLVSPLVDAETGAKSFKAAFSDMIKSIERDLFTIADKNIAQELFGQGGAAGGAPGFLAGLFGGNSGSSASGFAGLASLFGGGASNVSTAGFNSSLTSAGDSLINTVALDGAFAGGGTIGAGGVGLVGEDGPELAYAGSRDLHIQPMSSGRDGMHITVNAKADAPGGTITRRSSMQIASDAARQLSIAANRNR